MRMVVKIPMTHVPEVLRERLSKNSPCTPVRGTLSGIEYKVNGKGTPFLSILFQGTFVRLGCTEPEENVTPAPIAVYGIECYKLSMILSSLEGKEIESLYCNNGGWATIAPNSGAPIANKTANNDDTANTANTANDEAAAAKAAAKAAKKAAKALLQPV